MNYVDARNYLRNIFDGELVHRKFAAIKIGRQLKSWEVVHHWDGNKRNNSFDNLYVCSRWEHKRIHQKNLNKYNSWHPICK